MPLVAAEGKLPVFEQVSGPSFQKTSTHETPEVTQSMLKASQSLHVVETWEGAGRRIRAPKRNDGFAKCSAACSRPVTPVKSVRAETKPLILVGSYHEALSGNHGEP